MPMDFELFGKRFAEQLRLPLPGVKAQKIMAPRPINTKRFQEDFENPARLSAVMILLYPSNSDIFISLMKRPKYSGVHSGQISFPGGKHEKYDKDLIETALRETEEEIGVDRLNINIIGELTDLFIIVSNFKVRPVIGLIDHKPEFIPDPYEVEGVLNVSLNSLSDPKNQGIETMSFRNDIVINSPYYNVHGNIVWGATAMIISELLAIVHPILGE